VYLDALPAALAIPLGTSIGPAGPGDRGELETLLAACQLPVDGLEDAAFAVARIDGELVGCAGIEQHGEHGLLRSVAVTGAQREQHIGEALVADRLAWARSQVRDEVAGTRPFASISLLTTGAEAYFARLGFAPIDRAALPTELAASSQLKLPACSRAVAMTRRFYDG
jgi:amino-acid N-acetyltransferase